MVLFYILVFVYLSDVQFLVSFQTCFIYNVNVYWFIKRFLGFSHPHEHIAPLKGFPLELGIGAGVRIN